MKEGKIPAEELSRLLKETSRAPEVIVGADVGEDAAVVRSDKIIIITADPITFTEENIGTYTVAVNCNDIVAMGGIPKYLTTTILLPPDSDLKKLPAIFKEINHACRQAGVLWVGGHTEVTSAVTRTIISAQMVGSLFKEATVTSGAQAGELLVMSKWAGLEATTILAREKKKVCRKLLGREGFKRVLDWLHDPGISIIREGRILKDLRITAGHDPTEGGIATGIHEIASRSGVGARIDSTKIKIREETLELCSYFNLDPLGILSSGVFLFTAPPELAADACAKLNTGGIPAAVIGEITPDPGEIILVQGGKTGPLPIYSKDELLKVL
jgi:hydrogenase maturation factor